MVKRVSGSEEASGVSAAEREKSEKQKAAALSLPLSSLSLLLSAVAELS